MMGSNTINRGYLKRLIQRGQVEMVSSYHFDDQMGESRSKEPLLVRIREGHGDSKEGFCNLWESDLRSSCGFASKGEDGVIHLHVHSNCFFDLRLKNGTVNTQSAPSFHVDDEYRARVQEFADLVDVQTAMRLVREGYGAQIESHRVKVTFGKRYARIDVGGSGRYMVDKNGDIFGIKGYGVVHRGHRYGNLDTLD